MEKEESGPKKSVHSRYRDIHCENYSRCLSLTVALGWKSFTCKGCAGNVCTKLLWKAHAKSKADSLLKALCNPGDLRKEIQNQSQRQQRLKVINFPAEKTV